jgi:aminopeptidase
MLSTLADVIAGHCTRVGRGDLVTIVGEPAAMDAVSALYASILHAGGHPSFHVKSQALQHVLLRHGNAEQIAHLSPFERHRLETCDVLIVLVTPQPPSPAADPARVAAHQAARRGLLTMSLERLARGEVRYCLAELPTPAGAENAGMTAGEYEDLVCRAGFLHLPDPLAAWGALHERHLRMISFLERCSTLRFRAPACELRGVAHGATDLTLDVSGRTWLSRAGGENFPDGEVDSGPRGVDGVVCFAEPVVHQGVRVEGARLEFKGGRVVGASARANEDFLFHMLDMDAGSRTAGEVGIGTNFEITRFTANPFFDEKIGGTFHVALGAGYPETGNTNESGLHWDMVCDLRAGGTLEADDEVVQRDGRFLPAGWPGTE